MGEDIERAEAYDRMEEEYCQARAARAAAIRAFLRWFTRTHGTVGMEQAAAAFTRILNDQEGS